MVGLSVVLEDHNNYTPTTLITKKTVMPLVTCKPTVVKPQPSSASPSSAGQNFPFVQLLPPQLGGGFLDACFLCRQSLLPGKDIYMYKGDKAFCSEECRWKQMLMDDSDEQNTTTTTTTTTSRRKETVRGNYNYNDNCSLAAIKPTSAGHHRNPFAR